MYHISDVKRFVKCPRLYYLSLENKPEFVPYLRNDEELTELIIKKLKLENYYRGERGDDPSRVLENLDKYEWFVKSRFEYDELRIKIPFLHKVEEGFDLYFAYFGLFPREDDMEFYADNIWVLENNNIKINNIYIIHLNANYVMEDELNPDELFVISDCFYNVNNHPTHNIKTRIYARKKDLTVTLHEMRKGDLNMYLPQRKRACKAKNLCPFYKDCFGEDEKLEDDSILTLVSSKYKNKMFESGIRLLKDADPELLEGNFCQYAQIMASKNGGLYFDYQPLKAWMEELKGKTLAFIDFEWERYLVPPFKGLKPYDVVPFEYSLHVLYPNGKMIHKAFVGTQDCRREFIESMLANVPNDSILVAYNAIGAEMLRIKELASQFPEYAEELLNLNKRFVDMSYPFISGMIYDIRMRGNYSVKSLLGVVSNLNYQDLDISDGMEAVYKWRMIDRDEVDDHEEVIKSLIEYCSLDTYSLVLIYKWLNKILKDYEDQNIN